MALVVFVIGEGKTRGDEEPSRLPALFKNAILCRLCLKGTTVYVEFDRLSLVILDERKKSTLTAVSKGSGLGGTAAEAARVTESDVN